MENFTLIPNAPILIESTRSIGYTFEAALADIIDNSIAKNAKRIDINFDSYGSPFVYILDDGDGMTFEELKNAMRYGSKSSLDERDKDDLGRFGLGMKTASLSQCRKFTVFTKKEGQISGATWDLDYVIANNEWSLIVYDLDECKNSEFGKILNNKDSGTIVIWENFDRLEESTDYFQKTFDQKLEDARRHVSLVFHRFISDENIKNRIHIYFNYNEVKPIDPFLTDNPATQPLSEQTITINGEIIKVKPYILPYQSKLSSKDKKILGDLEDLRKTQGFYVYRNKRLIIWGTWFKLIKSHELNKLARVRVDIPNSLDSIWNIDIKKSSASLPDSIKRNLANIVKNTVGKSEDVYKYRGRKIKSDNFTHVWNVIDDRGKYKYIINKELPIFNELVNHLDVEGENCLNSLIEMIENSFPFEDIYYRMGKNQLETKPSIEDEKVYEIGYELIKSAKNQNKDISSYINNTMKYMDIFVDYPDIVEKLKEEFLNE